MDTGKYNILYVDDESGNLNSFKLLFRRKFNILTAESGDDGLKILENQPIDLIITDQRMPEMTGVEFLKKVKKKWSTLKCILLTGFTDNEAIKEAINVVGIYWYINKPFEMDQMEHLIKKAIEVSHIETEKKVSDEMLHMFLNTALDAIITIDHEQLITMINPAVNTMFGYDKEELLGQKIEILIPDSIKNHSQLIKDFGSSHNTSLVMMPNKTIYGKAKSGKLIPIETSFSKMEVAGEIFYNGIIRDVSQRIEAEKQLKESEEKFRSVFESMENVFIRVNKDGIIEMVSPSVMKLLGHLPVELIGKKTMNLYVNQEDRDRLLQEVQTQGFARDFEIELYTKDKKKKYVSTNAKLYNDEEGKPLGIESLIRDVTEKKKTELKIAANTELLKESQRLAHLGHISVNMATNEMEWSDEIYRIYGIDPNRIPDMEYILGLVHPDDLTNVKEGLNLAMKQVKDYNMEHRLIRANNEEVIWVHAQANMKFDRDGNPESLLSTVLDITEKKEAESKIMKLNQNLEQRVLERTSELEKTQNELAQRAKDLDAASQYKSQFLANMSHEIRTPLNAIMGFTELLSRNVTDATQKNYLEAINSSSKNLLVLINDILDLSKIEAGKMEMNYEFVDFRILISELEKVFALKVQEKGIKLIVDISDTLPDSLRLDEVRTRQILFNLVGNAIKFTNTGHVKLGVKCLSIKNKQITLQVEVSDTGVGITKKFQKELFESFTQQHGQDQQKYGGTGLGLSITKKLVTLMNGELTFTSEVKKGTTFIIELPNIKIGKHDPNFEITIDNSLTSETITFKKCTMVIADDNEANLDYINKIFQNEKIEIYDAKNGKELVKIAKSVKPDIILTDLRMPKLDGYGALKILRGTPDLKHIPVIAITASAMPESLKKVKKQGFDGVLTKPVSVNEIYNELCRFLPYERVVKKMDISSPKSISISNNDLNKILKKLEGQMMKAWSKFEEQQPLDEIEKFSNDLIELGNEYKFDPIIEYGHEILDAANTFDIEKLLNKLNHYPESVKSIRKLLKSK